VRVGLPGHTDHCSPTCPCPEGLADCDTDDDCEGTELRCIRNIGTAFGWEPVTNAVSDICVNVTRHAPTDCHNGVDIGTDETYCTPECPCNHGEGDCDVDDDCEGDLQCIGDDQIGGMIGVKFGYPTDETDVCIRTVYLNAPMPGTCAHDRGDSGSVDHCVPECPCPEGLGDCDTNADCEGSLECWNDIGSYFGWGGTIDACVNTTSDGPNVNCNTPQVALAFGESPGVDYCRNDCPCNHGVGACNVNFPGECVSGTVCVESLGTRFGYTGNYAVCMRNYTIPIVYAEDCVRTGNLGHWNHCTPNCPCTEGMADCNTDADCEGTEVVCVGSNSITTHFGFNDWTEACLNTTIHMSDGCHGGNPPGDADYCTDTCKCNYGEGDCDNNNQCADGLVCVNDLGPHFQYGSSTDVCIRPLSDENQLSDHNWTATCDRRASLKEGHCTSNCPCPEGVADCVNDVDCEGGLRCLHVGGYFNGAISDVCVNVTVEVPNSCHGGVGSGTSSYCTSTCKCTHGEGDCDNDVQCETGHRCIDDIGPMFDMTAGHDVCMRNTPNAFDYWVTECSGIGTPGDTGHCTTACPCPEGLAQCNDNDDACAGKLECFSGVGAHFNFHVDSDVCLNVVIEPSNECHGAIGRGDANYCTVGCKCKHGEGVCATSEECEDDHACVHGVALSHFGTNSGSSVCIRTSTVLLPEIANNNVGTCVRQGNANTADYCTSQCPCPENVGDCDTDDECEGDLWCDQLDGIDICKNT
jgi:hypothetical protein